MDKSDSNETVKKQLQKTIDFTLKPDSIIQNDEQPYKYIIPDYEINIEYLTKKDTYKVTFEKSEHYLDDLDSLELFLYGVKAASRGAP